MLAVLLAGGKNTRMQEPKWSIPYRGIPEWLRVKEMANQLGIPFVVSCSSASAGAFSSENVIVDAYDLGPIGGIVSVMEQMENVDAFLFIGCDLPFLEQQTVQRILGAYESSQTLVCASSHGSIEPMLSVWKSTDYADVMKLVSRGDLSLRSILASLNVSKIPVAPEELKNINTTEEKENTMIQLAQKKHD